MFKTVGTELWAFDAEWVPDIASGRRVYGLPPDASDESVLKTMWAEGGASADDPHPYLKTVVCRVVSIAAVVRKTASDGSVSLALHSLPSREDGLGREREILGRFLEGIGRAKPQLVGFNSISSDLTILLQRAMVHRLHLPDFCRRPQKPWEGIDYFSRHSEGHVDLKDEFSGWGRGTPSLHEFATCCGIPGKTLADGSSVVDLWLAGDIRRIVDYNECDALTTYLLWLRAALLAGLVSPAQHEAEERLLEAMLEERATAGDTHLAGYLDAWRQLRADGDPVTTSDPVRTR